MATGTRLGHKQVRKLDGPFFLYADIDRTGYWHEFRKIFVPQKEATLYHGDCNPQIDIQNMKIRAIPVLVGLNREFLKDSDSIGGYIQSGLSTNTPHCTCAAFRFGKVDYQGHCKHMRIAINR